MKLTIKLAACALLFAASCGIGGEKMRRRRRSP